MKNSEIIKEVCFDSNGTKCRGYFYYPKAVKKIMPVLIMAHGFGAEQSFRIPEFAREFVSLGIIVFSFDYRNFGKSEGEPRNLVSVRRHLQDWNAAVAFVRSLDYVDKNKIALWGSSFSGGHVLVTAAQNADIAAVISQVPFLDAVSAAKKFGMKTGFLLAVAAMKDLLRIATFRKPYTVPVVAPEGETAIMNKPGNYEGYLSIVPEDSTWKNETPARCVYGFSMYRPIKKVKKIKCPALILAADNDNLVPVKTAYMAARLNNKIKLVCMPVGHFDVYTGDWFNKTIKIEKEFLKEILFE